MFQLAYGCSPFPPPEGSLFSLPKILSPAREIFSGRDGLRKRLMAFQSAYGCSPFPPPEGSLFSLPEIISPAREIRSGRVRLMIQRSSRDGSLTRLMMFQSAYGCSPFPPPEGSLFSLPEIISHAWGIRSGLDG